MEGLLERNTIETTEKERHNAAINERYRQLFDTVEEQLASPVQEAYAPTYAPAPSFDTMPEVEQSPAVATYAPSALAASVFTAEKFERVESFEREQAVAPVEATPTAIVKAKPSAVVQYALTPFAKMAMAVFTLVVIAMLTLIGVNSQIIRQKSIRLQNLEEKKQELMEKNEEIQQYIRELQSEQSILQRAEQAGLLN